MGERILWATTIGMTFLAALAFSGDPEEMSRDISYCEQGEYRFFAGEGEGYRIRICRPVLPPLKNTYLRLTLTKPNGEVIRLKKDIVPEGGDISGQELYRSGSRYSMPLRIKDGTSAYVVYVNIDWHVSAIHLTAEAGLVIEENGRPVTRADVTAHYISNMSPGVFEEMSIPLEGPESVFPVPGVNEEAALDEAALKALFNHLEPQMREMRDYGKTSFITAVRPWEVRGIPCRLFIWRGREGLDETILGHFAVDIDNRIYEWGKDAGGFIHLGGPLAPAFDPDSDEPLDDPYF